jgi:uncharacterized protein (DUF58 family)
MSSHPLTRPLDRSYLLRALRGFYGRRLTARGRFVLWATIALALVGMDTRRSLVFMLFALAAPPLLLALGRYFAARPVIRLEGRLPSRLTAGRAARASLCAVSPGGRDTGPLSLVWAGPLPDAAALAVEPLERTFGIEGARPARIPIDLQPHRRGRYVLPAVGVARTDLFGLVRTKAVWLPEQVVLAYPRYHTLDALPLPMGRRYQPGGIPLASVVGDSLEFVGNREYREGDPLRKIDWRSSARLGRPVVREYQEEYFSRIALVLDTFLGKRPRPRERARFEAAISTLASVAEHFSRSEEVVDILAAGPDLYEVSTGRSLGYLDNVLDVLACLAPSPAPPFESIAPTLFERLERLTTVVAVMLEWDEAREGFLRRVRGMGVAVHVLLVHEGDTRKPWASVSAELGEIERLTPAQVEKRLAAEEGP